MCVRILFFDVCCSCSYLMYSSRIHTSYPCNIQLYAHKVTLCDYAYNIMYVNRRFELLCCVQTVESCGLWHKWEDEKYFLVFHLWNDQSHAQRHGDIHVFWDCPVSFCRLLKVLGSLAVPVLNLKPPVHVLIYTIVEFGVVSTDIFNLCFHNINFIQFE